MTISVTYVAFAFLAAFSSAALAAFYVRPRRAATGGHALMVLMLASAVWVLGSALTELASDLATKILLIKSYFLSIVIVPPALLVFALQYSGRQHWITRDFLILLAIIPVATLGLVWSNDAHHLFWTDMRWNLSGALPKAEYIHGPLYWVWIAFAYVVILVATICLSQRLTRTPSLFRWQVIVMLIGVAAPWLGNVMYLFQLTPWPYLDTTSFGFVITGLVMAYGVFRFQILDILPVARKSVLESMTDAVFVVGSSNHIVDMNPAAERMLGQPAAAVIGKAAERLLPAWPDILKIDRDGGEAYSEVTLGEAETQRHYDLRVLPIRNELDDQIGRLIIMRDVTEHTAALQASEERFRHLVEGSIQGILIHQDFKPLFVNQAYATIHGYDTSDDILRLETIESLAAPHERARWRQYKEARLRGEDAPTDFEYQAVRKDGALIWLENKVRVVTWGGAPAIQSTTYDITAHKQAEATLQEAKDAAEQANRAKSTFLATMSHELRTPLNSIIGFTNQVLQNKQENLQPKQQTYLERVRVNGMHLLQLINDILDLSKVEAGHMELELAPVHLDVAVEEVIKQCEAVVPNQVTLHAELPPLMAPFEADAGKLKQVLINLLSNALKFTSQGRVTLRVEVHPDTFRPAYIEVIDTGIGIPPEKLETIFESFQQVDNSMARKYGGTGLGLVISRSLCGLMGYQLEVSSELGKGTTFGLYVTTGGSDGKKAK